MHPFFSIILVAHNQENCIHNAIFSVLDQNFKDFELIIIDNGSKDMTASILAKYAQSNPKINIITYFENQSQHVARLDGVARSKGQYIMFLDGDDSFVKNAFKYLNIYIEKSQEYDFYEFGYKECPSGKKHYPKLWRTNRFLAYFKSEHIPAHVVWNKVYNSKIIKKAFNNLERVFINNTEDLYESIIIAYYAKRATIINKIIINYSIGTGISTTHKNYDKVIELLHSNHIVINCIDKFLLKTNQDININNLKLKCLKMALSHINHQINEFDKHKLIQKLSDYFSVNFLLTYFFTEIKRLESNLANSYSYRLGHILLTPFRILKRLFKRT